MYLSKSVKFDYPKLIVDTVSEQLSNFNMLTSLKYKAYLIYLILDKYSIHFQSLLKLEQLTPYEVIFIIHRYSFLRDPSQGFSNFVNEFASRVYYFIYEANYPRVPQQFQNYLYPPTKDQIGDLLLFPKYTVLRVYGSEHQPYMLPSLLTPRIFSLEVLMQILHSYELHFSSKKHTSTFKVPITVGPFTVKNRVAIELIDDMMACFCFSQDFYCQYDPLHIISKKRKWKKRGNYEHQGTPEMEQMANKITLPSGPNRQNEMMNLATTSTVQTDTKGKRNIGQDLMITRTTSPLSKNLKLFKDPFFQIVDYPTTTMETTTGEEANTRKTLIENYGSLKLQASQERQLTKEIFRSIQPPQLISALDKKSQMMKIAIIQPTTIGDVQNKKITEFKLNMIQFSVVDKVDFFKQTSELICSNLISTTVSKDKLFRDFKKLEGKFKTEQAKKKSLQIKRTQLEKKIVEINKGVGNEAMNNIIQEKEVGIKNNKKNS